MRKFRCQRCQRSYEIDDIYVGRRNHSWPNPMCKPCSQHYSIVYKNYERPINHNIKKRSPLDILLEAGYPKERAYEIIKNGL